MQLLILASLLGLVASAPSRGGYSSGRISRGGIGYLGGHGGRGGGGGGGSYGSPCGHGKVLHVDGSCVRPEVSRNVFVYAAPKLPVSYGPTPQIPSPKLKYNVVFVRTPQGPNGLEPIVVPPPLERTLVYVLTENGHVDQQVIEVPAGPGQAPEVFYVNYDEGDNPVLAGGLTLREALSSAAAQGGQFIGGGGSGGYGGGLISGGGVGGGVIIGGGSDEIGGSELDDDY